MSFQGIRTLRTTKRQSPLIFINQGIENYTSRVLPVSQNFSIKNLDKNEKRSTKDSEKKLDSIQKHSRNSSIGKSDSKQKQKKTTFGNFMHMNFDGLNYKTNGSKQLKPIQFDGLKDEKIRGFKADTQDNDRQDPFAKISLNSFNMDFCVGKGGFGKVWKVYQKNTGQVYAMKQMQKVKIISKRSVNSVMNQKKLLQKLSHPFLVNIIHAFQTREQLFLVMDYCNRGDMRYHIGNRRKFKEQEAKFFIACIILGLEYLHKNKIMHRDLKPENLVLDDKGYVRLTDLGVSRQVKPNNAEDTSGTPGYMAPQVICKMNHSYAVDFFALGVIAYEFMVGRRPYNGKNRQQIREKMLAKQVQLDEIPPFGWSNQSIHFINGLIQRKPEYRLGFSGIEQVKGHPWFKNFNWQRLEQRKAQAPFLPSCIEDDYNNYKQCISEDTEIQNMEEYKLVLRHKDTQSAFDGYEHNILSPRIKRKQINDYFTHTTMNIRKRQSKQIS